MKNLLWAPGTEYKKNAGNGANARAREVLISLFVPPKEVCGKRSGLPVKCARREVEIWHSIRKGARREGDLVSTEITF